MAETKVTIADQIDVVVEAREKAQEMANKKKAMYDEFISQHTDFFGDVVVAAAACSEAEDALREMAVAIYKKTDDKKVAPGVGIRVVTKLEYDPNVALDWGIAHHGIALKLDAKAFETVVKATPNIVDFVTITDKATATIATELAKVE
ncbi:hypothetical protein LCGC14_2701490 [marine sediment metagenome]|uniref:Uncharacterized protein n=1 Tax=marine sediment metagenome TaxID=412755 RepID=A0A0F9C7H4_9ZZZZ